MAIFNSFVKLPEGTSWTCFFVTTSATMKWCQLYLRPRGGTQSFAKGVDLTSAMQVGPLSRVRGETYEIKMHQMGTYKWNSMKFKHIKQPFVPIYPANYTLISYIYIYIYIYIYTYIYVMLYQIVCNIFVLFLSRVAEILARKFAEMFDSDQDVKTLVASDKWRPCYHAGDSASENHLSSLITCTIQKRHKHHQLVAFHWQDGLISVSEFTQMVQFVTVASWLESEDPWHAVAIRCTSQYISIIREKSGKQTSANVLDITAVNSAGGKAYDSKGRWRISWPCVIETSCHACCMLNTGQRAWPMMEWCIF